MTISILKTEDGQTDNVSYRAVFCNMNNSPTDQLNYILDSHSYRKTSHKKIRHPNCFFLQTDVMTDELTNGRTFLIIEKHRY